MHKLNYKINKNGVAALPAIIVIAMVILLVGVGISSTGFIENLSSYGELENKKALAAAEAGASDAFERLVRNKNCNSGTLPTCQNYLMLINNVNVNIEITDADTEKIITSIGQIGFKKVKIQVIISFDINGKATQKSWKEI